MNQLPPIHGHFESPVKYIKHILKLETNTFPTCETFIEKLKVGRIPFAKSTHIISIHHAPTCTWSLLHIQEKSGQLKFEKLSD